MKVMIEYNTEDKSCKIQAGDEEMTNIGSLYMHRYSDNEYSLEMVKTEKDKANKTMTHTRITAEDHGLKSQPQSTDVLLTLLASKLY